METATDNRNGGGEALSIDKVVIHGAEFTRVADKYLLQSEVEQALDQVSTPYPHFERLTTLLEDIVSAADAAALQVMEAQEETQQSAGKPESDPRPQDGGRELLGQVREGLREQIVRIDGFMHRLEG